MTYLSQLVRDVCQLDHALVGELFKAVGSICGGAGDCLVIQSEMFSPPTKICVLCSCLRVITPQGI